MDVCACSVRLLLFLAIALTIAPTPVESQCCSCPCAPPVGAKNKKFYLETSYKVNWYGAYLACFNNKTSLARVETEEENLQILELIKNNNAKRHAYWIGGNDLADEGRWRWLLTDQPLKGYTYWHEWEPNDNANNEDCLNYSGVPSNIEEHKWNDDNCNNQKYFVCEYLESSSLLDECDWKIG